MSNPVANKKLDNGSGPIGKYKANRRRRGMQIEAPPAHDESNWLVSYADMMTLLFGFFVLLYSFSKIDEKKFEIVRKDVARYFGGQVKTNPTVKRAEKQLEDIITQAGLDKNIELIARDSEIELRFNSSFHFIPGTATLNKESEFILGKLIDTVKRTVKADTITVEGHTDDNPIASEKYPSNWELSGARASTIVREFEKYGFDPTKMTSIGYGSSHPLVPNRDSKGEPLPENQELNRRVIVNIAFNRDIDDAIHAMKTGQFTPADALETVPDNGRTSLVHEGEGEPTWREKVTHDLGAVQEKMKLAEERLKETEARKVAVKQLVDMQGRLKQIETRIDTTEVETKRYAEQTRVLNVTPARVPASTPKVKTKSKSKARAKKKAKPAASAAPAASAVTAPPANK
jgi:chemotaxis protein MotB